MQSLPTKFTAFEFTEAELEQATTYTELQRAYLQTELANKAALRLAMIFNPLTINNDLQQEAYLKGQMELLEQLLLGFSTEN